MIKPNRYVEKSSIDYYAVNTLKMGDVVGINIDNMTVDRVHKTKDKIPYGISLHDVVDINKLSYKFSYIQNISSKGSRVRILTAGFIIQKFNKKLKMPIYQPIYVDLNKSILTWKKLGPQVGITGSNQDTDGFIKLKLNFERF